MICWVDDVICCVGDFVEGVVECRSDCFVGVGDVICDIVGGLVGGFLGLVGVEEVGYGGVFFVVWFWLNFGFWGFLNWLWCFCLVWVNCDFYKMFVGVWCGWGWVCYEWC